MPLAITSSNSSHLRSILRIPLIDSDSVFEDEEQQFHDGLVALHNPRYSAFLSFSDYETCIRDSRGTTTLCTLRPCLVTRSGREKGVRCFALNSTNFLLSSVSSPLHSKCGRQLETTENAKDGFKHLSLALHCELHSTEFVIKQVETEAVTDLPSEETVALSSIFAIKPESIVVERPSRRKVAIRVEASAIIRHLNSSLLSLHQRHSAMSSMPSAHHLMPVAVAGGSIGTIAIVSALVLFIILIIRR